MDRTQFSIISKEISFQGQNLPAFPKDIWAQKGLSDLEILDVSSNKIKSLPPEIRRLKKLKILRLDNNNLSTIPREIGELTCLEELTLDCNHYQEYYEPVCMWVGYEEHKLRILPKEILNLEGLKKLDQTARTPDESLQTFIKRAGYKF